MRRSQLETRLDSHVLSPSTDVLDSEVKQPSDGSAVNPDFHSNDDELIASPPPVLVEPEVPDPFIVDDGEDSDSDTGHEDETLADDPPSAADEIALAPSTVLDPASSQPSDEPLQSPVPAPIPQNSVNVDKAVPSLPSLGSEEEEEEEAPELYLPGLIIPTMFLPIPNTDPLTTLLTKYISPEKRPARDLTGDWQRNDFHTLVMTNSWRALARMARDRIVVANPEDLTLILSLWYLRLASLARLRLFNQTSAECSNLFTVLNAIEPAGARAWLFERILPFELEVLEAKTKYWAGDHMGYLDALVALLKRCKEKSKMYGRKKDPSNVAMWKERGARVCLIVASQLIEMKDYLAAARLLEPLCTQEDGASSPHMQSAVARIYLQGGYIAMAMKHFAAVAQDTTAEPSLKAMDAALLASAEGDWERATNALRQIVQNDSDNYAAVNNLAVALLSRGHLKEGIQVLEDALQASPSTIVVAEPFLFNLSTLYELRSTTAADKKRGLLVEVAKWAGDGLRTACLKMPVN
ncbi:hypothetical protein EW026_g4723 [Hermanssonia centrifuga]|uniref:Uncharacterized protein n=1 Tax=Hermanssonia centrifuga TaxID=98765 RepID=A0A4S4KH01_9APHY|nr:hypothetical protein EW026_g4723 [Hermanssonia centrifuga]